MDLKKLVSLKQDELNAINAKLNALTIEIQEYRELGLKTVGAIEALKTAATEQVPTTDEANENDCSS